MRNKMVERFTISFYENNIKDEVLLNATNFHSNSERFRGLKIKEWAYEYLKEHPELLREMESIQIKENSEVKNSIVVISEKEEKVDKLRSKLNIVTSKKEE